MMDLEHLNQSRLLALKLSALEPGDYQWLQAQVPEAAWQTLAPLVDEIRSLGFGLQYTELLELLALNSKNDAAKQKSRQELMNDLQWEELLHLFESENESLLPLFSSLYEWQWKSSSKFIEYRKRRSHQFSDNWGDRPLLKEALLEVVSEALQSGRHVAPIADKTWLARIGVAFISSLRRVTARFKRGSAH